LTTVLFYTLILWEPVRKVEMLVARPHLWLQHGIIDAIRQWRTRLHACIKAKGRHFEHKL